jgi:hypothetical protein
MLLTCRSVTPFGRGWACAVTPIKANANRINTETIRIDFFIFSFQLQRSCSQVFRHTSPELIAPNITKLDFVVR